MKRFHLLVILLLTGALSSSAQAIGSSIEVQQLRVENALDNFKEHNIVHSLSGKKYNIRHIGAINSQFFKADKPQIGSLIYDGVLYDEIEMQYDLFSQQIIILLTSQNNIHYVSIDDKRVSEFRLGSNKFVQIVNDSIMESGIYQMAYSGQKSSVFIKRMKSMKEQRTTTEIQINFRESNKYYLRNENGTFEITNKKSLLKAFQNSERLHSTLKTQKIKFSKKQLESSLLQTVLLIESNQLIK